MMHAHVSCGLTHEDIIIYKINDFKYDSIYKVQLQQF
jgi:hypothetical protein